MLRAIAIVILLIFSTCIDVLSQQSGFGSDIPTNVLCTASQTDSSLATCTFDTTLVSDSEIGTIDSLNNSGETWYDPTMTTHHTVQLNHLPPLLLVRYFAAACTHVTYTSPGMCPRTSPDISSNGPAKLMPTGGNNRPTFTTIARPGGTLSSWSSYIQAPKNVFVGQSFVIDANQVFGIGEISQVSGVGVNYILLHDVTIDTPSSGTWQCGTLNTNHTPNYWQLGQALASGLINCQGAAAPVESDFTIALLSGPGWVQNNNLTGLTMAYSANIGGSGNSGYYALQTANNNISRVFVRTGLNLTPGSYTIHFHLQPLFAVTATGNETGGALVSQDHTHDVTLNVMSATPLPKSPPTTPPVWSFFPEHLVMAAYWQTWNCSDRTTNPPTGSWNLYNFSGSYENVAFSPTTWGNWAWNYDTGRNALGLRDLLFASPHSDWVANHTYTIGDLITRGGVTYIMQAVNGANLPGMSGTSAASAPAFNTGPSLTTADGPLEWLSVGDPTYWDSCALLGNDGYRNNILINQAFNNQEWTQFPAGIVMHFFQTGDATGGDETGLSYTETNGKFGGITAFRNSSNSCLTSTDPSIVLTGTSTYWTGGDRLAMCYSASFNSLMANSAPNDNLVSAMRVKGLTLNMLVANWMVTNRPAWVSTDDGQRMLRMVDTAMATLDMFATLTPTELVPTTPAIASMSTYYMSGQVSEALLHYYQATVYYSNQTMFPGTTIVPDERIPIALKRYADWAWVNEFDRIYDKNQVVTDACNASYPTICTNNNTRLHSYSFPYNHNGLSDKNQEFEFFNVAGSNSELAFIYSWLWSYNSTLQIPNNGRDPATTYADAAMLIMQHAWDGKNCPQFTATSPGRCLSWGAKDYWRGGRATAVGGYTSFLGEVQGSKAINQVQVNDNSEGIHWLNGTYTWQQNDLMQSTNPCWIAANRNPDGSCNQPSPFADTQPPYPFTLGINGTSPYNPGPQTCIPGRVGAGAWYCGTQQRIGTQQVLLDNAVTATTAHLTFFTVENTSQCYTVVGTVVTEPPAASLVEGQNKFSESPTHTPLLIGGTPLPLWFHSIVMTGLAPATLYRYGLYCTDKSGNIYNMPYQIAAGTGRMNIDPNEQQPSFTTTAAGTGFTISGTVSGVVASGVLVQLTGSNTGQTYTDGNGNYSFTESAGTYTLTPVLAGFSFSPASITVPVSGNTTGQNFTSSSNTPTFQLSGYVQTADSTGIAGVSMALTGPITSSQLTDSTGQYSFTVPDDGVYTVTPSLAGYTFVPPNDGAYVHGGNFVLPPFIGTPFTQTTIHAGHVGPGAAARATTPKKKEPPK